MNTSAKYFCLAVGPRSGTSSQKRSKTYLTYNVTHKKSTTPNQKFSFHCRLAESFEGLNSSLAQSANELCTFGNFFHFQMHFWKSLNLNHQSRCYIRPGRNYQLLTRYTLCDMVKHDTQVESSVCNAHV